MAATRDASTLRLPGGDLDGQPQPLLQQRPIIEEGLHEHGVLVRIAAAHALAVKIEAESDVTQFRQVPGPGVLEVAGPSPGM